MNKKIWKKDKGLILTIIALGIIIIVLSINLYSPINSSSNKQLSVKIIEIKNDCKECLDIGLLADSTIQEQNLNVKSREIIEPGSEDFEKLIEKYNIKTIPSLIILSKDIEKIGLEKEVFSIKDDYAIFDKSVPYFDLNTKQIKGLVQLTEIQSDSCLECTPMLNLRKQLEGLGIKVENYEIISSSSERGKEIIEKNNLNFVSVLLISKDIEEYWWIFDQLKDSIIENEDNYVFKDPFPPYFDLTEKKVKGKVNIIFLENKSCEDCFNVSQLKDSFQQLGVYFSGERYVDVSSSEGKNLLKNYNITAIPTLILSKEIKDYESLESVLAQVGDFQNNQFVFRRVDSLKVKYQELS